MKFQKLIFFVLLIPTFAYSQLTAHKGEIEDSYNFWLYLPETYNPSSTRIPLIIFLHGHSLCGNDLNRVRKYGCIDAIEHGLNLEAAVIAPQNPSGPWKPDKIDKILDWTLEHYSIDTNRVYVFGMSLGGYGTLDYTGTYPNRIAAAIALCGGANLKDYCGLGTFPLWIIHGTADKSVPLSQSEKVINAIKRCGPTPMLRFSALKGLNHSYLARAFYISEPYEWLFCHKRGEIYLNKNISITQTQMAQAYSHREKKTISVWQVLEEYRPQEVKQEDTLCLRKDITSKTLPLKDPLSNSQAQFSENVSEDSLHLSSDSNVQIYLVKRGDTLYAIAKKFGSTIERLCELNAIKETAILRIGQQLRVN